MVVAARRLISEGLGACMQACRQGKAGVACSLRMQREHKELLNKVDQGPPASRIHSSPSPDTCSGNVQAAVIDPTGTLQQIQAKLDALKVRKQRITGEPTGAVCEVSSLYIELLAPCHLSRRTTHDSCQLWIVGMTDSQPELDHSNLQSTSSTPASMPKGVVSVVITSGCLEGVESVPSRHQQQTRICCMCGAGTGIGMDLQELQQHANTPSERLLMAKLLEAGKIMEEQETVSEYCDGVCLGADWQLCYPWHAAQHHVCEATLLFAVHAVLGSWLHIKTCMQHSNQTLLHTFDSLTSTDICWCQIDTAC